jgi:hypothetical protein
MLITVTNCHRRMSAIMRGMNIMPGKWLSEPGIAETSQKWIAPARIMTNQKAAYVRHWRRVMKTTAIEHADMLAKNACREFPVIKITKKKNGTAHAIATGKIQLG